MFNYSDTDEDGISDQLEQPVYRVSGAGINVGLSALIRIAPMHYVAYSKSFYGAYVLIHGPEDYPQASVTTVVGQPGCDLAIAVTPSVVVSEPSIRDLPQKKRNCLFDDEVCMCLYVMIHGQKQKQLVWFLSLKIDRVKKKWEYLLHYLVK